MTTSPHYHIGILVDDMEVARERFTRALGVHFEPVTERILESPGNPPVSHQIKLCYSIEGPPYYELIEALDDGVFGRQQGEGVHHVGVFMSDAHAEKEALERIGVDTEFEMGRVVGPTGESHNLAWYTDPSSLHGVRFEFIDDTMRSILEERLTDPGRQTDQEI